MPYTKPFTYKWDIVHIINSFTTVATIQRFGATRRYTVDEVLDAVFDDDFGLSDGRSSEEGEDLYAMLGDPIVLCSDTDALTDKHVDSGVDGTSGDDSDGDSGGRYRADDDTGALHSPTDPEDPLDSMVIDDDAGNSSPSFMCDFAGTSWASDNGEVSDVEHEINDERSEQSEGESDNKSSKLQEWK